MLLKECYSQFLAVLMCTALVLYSKHLKHMRINNGKSPAARSNSAFRKTFQTLPLRVFVLFALFTWLTLCERTNKRAGFSIRSVRFLLCTFVFYAQVAISFVRLHSIVSTKVAWQPNDVPSKIIAKTFLNASNSIRFHSAKTHVIPLCIERIIVNTKFINRKIYLLKLFVCVCMCLSLSL